MQMVVDDEKGSKVEVEFFACSHAFQKVTPGPHTRSLLDACRKLSTFPTRLRLPSSLPESVPTHPSFATSLTSSRGQSTWLAQTCHETSHTVEA